MVSGRAPCQTQRNSSLGLAHLRLRRSNIAVGSLGKYPVEVGPLLLNLGLGVWRFRCLLPPAATRS